MYLLDVRREVCCCIPFARIKPNGLVETVRAVRLHCHHGNCRWLSVMYHGSRWGRTVVPAYIGASDEDTAEESTSTDAADDGIRLFRELGLHLCDH